MIAFRVSSLGQPGRRGPSCLARVTSMPAKTGGRPGPPAHSPHTASLLKQIAELSGAINRKRAIDQAVHAAKTGGPSQPKAPARPASAPPGLSSAAPRPPQLSRNRTLVNPAGPAKRADPVASRGNAPVALAKDLDAKDPADSPPQWIKKRSHQLILKSALPSVAQSALVARKRIQAQLAGVRLTPGRNRTLQRTATLPQSPAAVQLKKVAAGERVEINGVEYRKSARGNKFTRVGAETPRTASLDGKFPRQTGSRMQTVVIHGVSYVRDPARPNKLVLKSVSDAKAATEKQFPKAVALGGKVYVRTVNGNLRLAHKKQMKKGSRSSTSRPKKACRFYTRFGYCNNGTSCRYAHSDAHRAMCPLFLVSRPHDKCTLSHDPVPQNRPLCRHFQTGRCRAGVDCRFAHIKLASDAKVCRDFAGLGWCDRGDACLQKHYRICPKEDEKGSCGSPKCRFPHSKKKEEKVPKSRVPSRVSEASSVADTDELFGFDFDEPDPALLLAAEDEEVDMDISSDEDEYAEDEEDRAIELSQDDEIEEVDVESMEVSDPEEAPDVIVLEGEDQSELEDEASDEPEEQDFVGLGAESDNDSDSEIVDYEIDFSQPIAKRRRRDAEL